MFAGCLPNDKDDHWDRTGEKAFIGYAGTHGITTPIVNQHTGEILFNIEMFVAVLGTSHCTYARPRVHNNQPIGYRAMFGCSSTLVGYLKYSCPTTYAEVSSHDFNGMSVSVTTP